MDLGQDLTVTLAILFGLMYNFLVLLVTFTKSGLNQTKMARPGPTGGAEAKMTFWGITDFAFTNKKKFTKNLEKDPVDTYHQNYFSQILRNV